MLSICDVYRLSEADTEKTELQFHNEQRLRRHSMKHRDYKDHNSIFELLVTTSTLSQRPSYSNVEFILSGHAAGFSLYNGYEFYVLLTVHPCMIFCK